MSHHPPFMTVDLLPINSRDWGNTIRLQPRSRDIFSPCDSSIFPIPQLWQLSSITRNPICTSSWDIKCIDRRPTAWLEDSQVATSKTASWFFRMAVIRVRRDEVSLGYPKDARSGHKA